MVPFRPLGGSLLPRRRAQCSYLHPLCSPLISRTTRRANSSAPCIKVDAPSACARVRRNRPVPGCATRTIPAAIAATPNSTPRRLRSFKRRSCRIDGYSDKGRVGSGILAWSWLPVTSKGGLPPSHGRESCNSPPSWSAPAPSFSMVFDFSNSIGGVALCTTRLLSWGTPGCPHVA